MSLRKHCAKVDSRGLMGFCGFCRRFRFRLSDVVFMVIMCVCFYFVYTHHFNEIKQERAERKEAFKALQKACLMGDNEACKRAYGDEMQSSKP